MNNPTRLQLSDVSRIGAASIFLFLAILLGIARLPLPFEPVFSPLIHLIAAGALAAFAGRRLAGPGSLYIAIAAITGFLAIIVIWAFATKGVYEVGQDGHSYHLAAIWSIVEGWNPFYGAPHVNIWVDSYPNGYWILEAYIVSLTGLLLSGKSLGVGIFAAVMLLAFGFFQQRFAGKFRFSTLAALVLSGIVVANPVVLTQIMTHYVDGPLYLIGTALLFFLLLDTFTPSKLNRFGAVACILLMVNMKTAALYYVPLITIAVFLASALLKQPGETFIRFALARVMPKAVLYGAAFVIGIAVVGYRPYVTNVIDHRAFLYPPVDEIMDTNVPENLERLSGPEKFLYGIFSRTEDSIWPVLVTAPVNLKFPGSVRLSEFKDLDFDTRRGGFGPLFSLAFLLAIAAYGLARLPARDAYSINARTGDILALTGGFLILISAAFPEPWWARYIPFVWLAPLLLALGSLFHLTGSRRTLLVRGLFVIVIACFFTNILAGILGAARQSWNTHQRTVLIVEMKRYPTLEITSIEDPRETRDHQSNVITSSEMVWLRLLRERGLDPIVTTEFVRENCTLSGFFDGNILWCVKGQPEN